MSSSMSMVELKKAVTELSPEQLKEFRAWFAECDMAQWDKQIEQDSAAGCLDRLAEEALEDYRAGRTKEICTGLWGWRLGRSTK
jgi:hypothetical protein